MDSLSRNGQYGVRLCLRSVLLAGQPYQMAHASSLMTRSCRVAICSSAVVLGVKLGFSASTDSSTFIRKISNAVCFEVLMLGNGERDRVSARTNDVLFLYTTFNVYL